MRFCRLRHVQFGDPDIRKKEPEGEEGDRQRKREFRHKQDRVGGGHGVLHLGVNECKRLITTVVYRSCVATCLRSSRRAV